MQAVLNAAVKLPAGTITRSARLRPDRRFASLGTTPSADAPAVLGTIDAAGDGDYYAFHLNAGQSASLAAQGQNGNVGLEL